MGKVSELKFSILDRVGHVEVVELKHVLQLEAELQKAKDVLKEIAIRLLPEPGQSLIAALDEVLVDANVAGMIEHHGLCIVHHGAKGKVEKGQEWAVQTDDYSEMFERSTLAEAVKACTDRVTKKMPTAYVDSLLTKKE